MPGLVPGIHVFLAAPKTWMAGTSPAVTENVPFQAIRGRWKELVDHKAGEILIQEFVEPMGLTQGALAKAWAFVASP